MAQLLVADGQFVQVQKAGAGEGGKVGQGLFRLTQLQLSGGNIVAEGRQAAGIPQGFCQTLRYRVVGQHLLHAAQIRVAVAHPQAAGQHQVGVAGVRCRAVGVPQHLDGGGVFALGVEELSVVGSQQRQRLQPYRLLPPALKAPMQGQLPGGEKGLPLHRQRAHLVGVKGIQQQGVRCQRTGCKNLPPGLHQLFIEGIEIRAAGEQGLPAGR